MFSIFIPESPLSNETEYFGPYSGFTLRGEGVLSSILTDAYVSAPDNEDGLGLLSSSGRTVKALWDTGATNCVVTDTLAKELGLPPIMRLPVRHGGGESMENVYLLDITLVNGVRFSGLRVTECHDVGGEFGLIIGMDIICSGDLAITNNGGVTVVSFRHPSKYHIDFDDEIMRDNELFYQRQHI